MIALSKLRTLLGSEAISLSDEHLESLRTDMYKLVDLAFDKWVKDKDLDPKIGRILPNKL